MKIAWSMWQTYGEQVECLECGKGLYFAPMHCAHVLPKAGWEKLRTHPLNMIPLCEKDHRRFDGGDFKKMLMYESVSDLQTKLKLHYDTEQFNFGKREVDDFRLGDYAYCHRLVSLYLSRG